MTSIKKVIDFPQSEATVRVSIIDTSVRFLQWHIDPFVEPPRIAGHSTWTAPSWSFKIVHPSHGTYLFDLGVRKDWQTKIPQNSLDIIKKYGWTLSGPDKDVAQILSEQGEKLDDIKGIIWSHWHWDHVGDPSKFPATTKLIVGPGFKADILPGYPEDPRGKASSDAWEGREIVEVEITEQLVLGGYPALDYFGDGSFYLLDTPGHTVGHLCGLARTTADPDASFIYMGGDVVHLVGQVRPTEHIPLPDRISPNPKTPTDPKSFCPCAGYVEIHPEHSTTKPYYKGSKSMATDVDKAEASTRKLEAFDGDDRVLTVIAHDDNLEGVIDTYPREANKWKEKNWKKLAHWKFLKDFEPKEDA